MLIRKDGLLCLVGGFERICRWHIPHLAPERLKRSWGRISTTFCRRFEADPSLSSQVQDCTWLEDIELYLPPDLTYLNFLAQTNDYGRTADRA
jgi:hypothetical protein